MKGKVIIISVLAVLALLVYVALSRREYHYDWDFGKAADSSSEQPYGMKHFDEMMRRSLPLGYAVDSIGQPDVKTGYTWVRKLDRDMSFETFRWLHDHDSEIGYNYNSAYDDWLKLPEKIVHKREQFATLSDFADADTSKNILVVQNYDWRVPYGSGVDHEAVDVFHSLLAFAERGGTAMLVYPQYCIRPAICPIDGEDKLRLRLESYGITNGKLYTVGYSHLERPKFDLQDMRSCQDTLINMITAENDTLLVNIKFIKTVIDNDHNGLNEHEYSSYYKDKKVFPQVRPVMRFADSGTETLDAMVDLYYPESGGHLYLSTLGLYFSNLGLNIPEGPKVIEHAMSQIDDKPVVRLTYPRNTYSIGWEPEDALTGSPMRVVGATPGLKWAWMLGLAFLACLLARGLLRRQPAAKGAEIDEVDKTDMVAMREYKFRNSPLLHFLFQTSWLYQGGKDYNELFEINFNRLARTVAKHTNVELATATPPQFDIIARYFAVRQGRKIDEVVDDLKWMQQIKYKIDNSTYSASHKVFSRSQDVVEKFNENY